MAMETQETGGGRKLCIILRLSFLKKKGLPSSLHRTSPSPPPLPLIYKISLEATGNVNELECSNRVEKKGWLEIHLGGRIEDLVID